MNKEFVYPRTPERMEKLRKVLEKRQPDLTLVIENVDDPHNVSAVVRSCDAVGVYDVCLVYTEGREFPELGAKSSASAKKWLNFRKFRSIKECYEELRKENKKIYTTHLNRESKSLYDLDLTQPVALVFGNEHSGVSDEAVELADGNFLIPQVGVIQSLNISVACAVSLYEAFRQRQIAGKYLTSQFSEEEFIKIYNDWLSK
ncbi:MAG: RNA methyltransferase [Candidatus Kapabacteria bacterium]|nr:RNA methyltransferase [Candidatus Kapabacteria bacterium]